MKMALSCVLDPKNDLTFGPICRSKLLGHVSHNDIPFLVSRYLREKPHLYLNFYGKRFVILLAAD